jgi:hypothetical protein
MKIKYINKFNEEYIITKEDNEVKITNGIGTIIIEEELLILLEEIFNNTEIKELGSNKNE